MRDVIFYILLFFKVTESASSTLWGSNEGNLWGGPSTRIGDFSFAGFEFGDKLLPFLGHSSAIVGQVVDVRRDFGALGDGLSDDSSSIQLAFDSISSYGNRSRSDGFYSVIYFPTGVYSLDFPVYLRKSGVVIQGDGIGKTVISPTRSLFDVFGQGDCNAGSNKGYGWCMGFLELDSYTSAGSFLANINGPSFRGDTSLFVDSTENLAVGDEVLIRMTDDSQQSMYRYLLGFGEPADGRTMTIREWSSRISSIPSGSEIVLERPLAFDVRQAWSPELVEAKTSVERTGIEDLTIDFPDEPPYPGHHKGYGFNAIEWSSSHHSFIRRVEIIDADLAINLRHSYQCTVEDIIFRTHRSPDSARLCGHHGIDLTGSSSNLLQNLKFLDSAFVHDITVDDGIQNVITSSYFSRLSADHHGQAPFNNLWDNLVSVEHLERVYTSGGSSVALPHSGQMEIFWNVRTFSLTNRSVIEPINHLPSEYWFKMVITPYRGDEGPIEAEYFLESIQDNTLEPPSLYFAQLRLRNPSRSPILLSEPGTSSGIPCRLPTFDPSNLDPNCSSLGISTWNNGACCPLQCGDCGGSGCSDRPGGAAACCAGPVEDSGDFCQYYPPPCIPTLNPLPPLLPSCEEPLFCGEQLCVSDQLSSVIETVSANSRNGFLPPLSIAVFLLLN